VIDDEYGTVWYGLLSAVSIASYRVSCGIIIVNDEFVRAFKEEIMA
jgi:hypothetical protein